MEIVDYCVLSPGECIATKSAEGPLIDTQFETRYGERIYLRCSYVEEMGQKLGMATKREVEAMQETCGRVDELEAEKAELEDELSRLKNAVRVTLYQGAVVERVNGEDSFKLRPKKGEKTVAI